MVWPRALSDPSISDPLQAAWPAKQVGQVDQRHRLFGCIYGPRVGDTPISPGAGLLGLGYTTHTSSFKRVGCRVGAVACWRGPFLLSRFMLPFPFHRSQRRSV